MIEYMKKVITRFPPSPTGHLHIGGARTALFNWLLARSQNGRFILRIEDTDIQRSNKEMTDSILEAMSWLGLNWDAGPFFQSECFDIYNENIDYLLKTGQAYYCQCSESEVEAMRKEAWSKGEKPKYNGKCRDLNLGPGKERVVRFKSPLSGQTVFQDAIRGTNVTDNKELDDFILKRADNTPTYNLAVVVDDARTEITHILRGDDHLSNTPKQILLYKALGYEIPVFGHVPMILGADKKRLSKRHGSMAVLQYKEKGYLPEALINYLVRLGWSYGDQEIFDVDELIRKFSVDNIGKSACIFDPEKLKWVNFQHIKKANSSYLSSLLAKYLNQSGYKTNIEHLKKIVPLLQPRASTLVEMSDMAICFVIQDDELEYDPDLIKKFITSEISKHLNSILKKFKQMDDFSQKDLEHCVGKYLEEQNIKFKLLAQPLRVAITGKTASPGLFETMEVLGKESVINRITKTLEMQIQLIKNKE